MSADDIRVEIYRSFIEESRAPMAVEVAGKLGLSPERVVEGFRSLHDDDVIALVPGTDLIWLAHPFSAVDSPFTVASGKDRWDGICVWDALGILALLERDGTVTTACPDCGEPLELEVKDGALVEGRGLVAHYGVPAARWYEDVGYT
jgi:hypothetical protein